MSEKQKLNSLFSEFPPITKEEWEAKIHKDLKVADYKKKFSAPVRYFHLTATVL